MRPFSNLLFPIYILCDVLGLVAIHSIEVAIVANIVEELPSLSDPLDSASKASTQRNCTAARA